MQPAEIKSQLCKLSESSPEGAKRKSLFNLIVYTHTPNKIDYFKRIADSIKEQFPCRIIFIQGDHASKKSNLNVTVSVGAKGNGQQQSCDQIDIQAAGEDLAKVPFLILPHLIPDLPIYLFWGQDPSKEMTILPYLKKIATRLVLDSETTDDLNLFSHVVLNELNDKSTEIVDMNWVRTLGWRQLLARTFDLKERIELLKKATFMKIVYNNRPDPAFERPETQAIYLQAWIAACLDWKFKKIEHLNNEIKLIYSRPGGEVEIRLIPEVHEELAPEEIIEWEIKDPENYSCNFVRKSQDLVMVDASSQYQCILPFTLILPSLQSGRSFMQEIFYQKISEHYPKALKLISLASWR